MKTELEIKDRYINLLKRKISCLEVKIIHVNKDDIIEREDEKLKRLEKEIEQYEWVLNE